MKEIIFLSVICVLITLGGTTEQNIDNAQLHTDEADIRDTSIPTKFSNEKIEGNENKSTEQMQQMQQMQQDLPMEETDAIDEEDDEDDFSKLEEKEDEKDDESDMNMSQDFLAAGDNFQSMAALTPANPDLIYSSGISTKHVIGYVPITTSTGQALIFPAGAVRIVQPSEPVALEADFVERAVKRQNNAKRNKRRKSQRRRSNYRVYQRPENYYWQRRWPMASYGRRPTNNKARRYGNKRRVFRNY